MLGNTSWLLSRDVPQAGIQEKAAGSAASATSACICELDKVVEELKQKEKIGERQKRERSRGGFDGARLVVLLVGLRGGRGICGGSLRLTKRQPRLKREAP